MRWKRSLKKLIAQKDSCSLETTKQVVTVLDFEIITDDHWNNFLNYKVNTNFDLIAKSKSSITTFVCLESNNNRI
tara:strand:- start:79 stop:303 length:225 start_codon:yes stop_codon:yes gene_type:complete